MKTHKIVLAFILLTTGTYGCDICGCALGGNYYGILPQFNKNFVGIRWTQAQFHTYINHNSEFLPPEYSNDTYSKTELWGRFYLSPKFQVFTFVPYIHNSMNGNIQNVEASGLGDITVLGNYTLFNNGDDSSFWKQSLMVGGGVKLPIGHNDLKDAGALINPNFQMGTGSFDFLLNASYTIRFNKLGLTAETGYKLNSANDNGYHFGNQFHSSAQIFLWQSFNIVSLLPNAGLYYEEGAMHHEGNIVQINTGGSALLATAGLESYVGPVSIGVNYRMPIHQSYNSEETAKITSKDRWSVSATYNF